MLLSTPCTGLARVVGGLGSNRQRARKSGARKATVQAHKAKATTDETDRAKAATSGAGPKAMRRRQVLRMGGALAAVPLAWLAEAQLPALALEEEVQVAIKLTTYTEPVSGFSVTYPADWISAIKRTPTEANKPETLSVVGNFKDVDTVSVLRERAEEGSTLANAFADKSAADVAEQFTSAQANNSATLKFKIFDASWREAPNGDVAVVYEYCTETCRGRKIEGAGGELFCVGVQEDTPVQTIKRHTVATLVLHSDGYLYNCVGSAAEERWEEASPTLRAVVESFSL